MFKVVSVLLSLTAPTLIAPCCLSPDPGGQKGTRTSSKALQFAPQRPTAEEKEANRKRLGITVQQQQQIDDLYKETGQRMEEVRKAMGDRQRELWDVYANYDIDEGRARALRIEILKLHRKMGEIHADNERKLRAILTREQFGKLRELMKEQFEKRRQDFERRRGRPGGPPGSPPPP